MVQKNKKLLVVDDNLKIQEILSKFFQEENYQVFNAHTGKEALKLAIAEKPDLILLDLILPGEGGIEVLKKLAKDVRTKNIPTIILTNIDDKEKVEEAKKEGADKYLAKSHYKLKEILKEVEETIKEKTKAETLIPREDLIVMLNDDEFLLSIFKNILEKRGFKFRGFSTIPPSDITKMLKGLRPMVIVVDLVMCFDGIKVIGELKASQKFQDVPIIVLDNIYHEEEIKEAKKAGADTYISMKDNNPNQAIEKILKLLPRHI
ncbi:MAG: response regulator [Patescibacteria group bacterium]|nr:response regulator [Patescibacteria group bacterium]